MCTDGMEYIIKLRDLNHEVVSFLFSLNMFKVHYICF